MICDRLFDARYVSHPEWCYANTVPAEMADTMHQYVSRLDPCDRSIFQRHHFEHWGISEWVLRRLFNCQYDYEMTAEADHATRNHLFAALYINAHDFHRVHMLITLMRRHCRIEVLPLARETAESQHRALRLRHQIPVWRNATPDHFMNYFCPTCERLCCRVVTPCWARANRTDQSGFFMLSQVWDMGHDHVKWDPDQQQLLCHRSTLIKANSFQSTKEEAERDGDVQLLYRAHRRLDMNTLARRARAVRKDRFDLDCHGTVLQEMCFIGCALRIGRRVIVACETCFAKLPFSTAAFGPHGLTCTAHIHDLHAPLRPDAMLYPRFGPLENIDMRPALNHGMLNVNTNPLLDTQGHDWTSYPTDATTRWEHGFGVINQTRALMALSQLRPGSIAAASSSSSSGANNSNAVMDPLSAASGAQATRRLGGLVNTKAMVATNLFIVTVLENLPTYERNRTLLEYTTHCFFCTKKRPANDAAWVVFVVNNDQHEPVLIFVCPNDHYRFPTIQQAKDRANGTSLGTRFTLPHMTLQLLMDAKQGRLRIA